MRLSRCAVVLPVCLFPFLLLSPFAAEPAPARIGGAAAVDAQALGAYLERAVAAYRIPGLSFALVERGRPLFVRGYGEAGRGGAARPIGPDTRFFLGSTSKAFTALAVLKLAEEGKLDLDAPYKRYVPEFSLPEPGAAEKITVRELLNHTSGLSDRGLSTSSVGEASIEAELERLKGCRLASEPGSRFRYYNPNYRLLSLLVERVSGESYGDFLAGEVFGPLGMGSSRAGPIGLDGAGGPIAVGHGVLLGLPFERRQTYRPGALASGYLVSSAADLGAFLEAELAAAGGEARGGLEPESLEASWKAPAGVSGYEEGTSYGMGWMIVQEGEGGSFLFHGGALENYQSALYLDPDSGRGFALLMNEGGLAAQASLGSIQTALIGALRGRPLVEPRPRPIVLILAALLVVVAAAEAFRCLRLGADARRPWRRGAGARRPWRNWLGAALELAAALFILLGLLPLGNAASGEIADWPTVYGLAPEVALAAGLAMLGGLYRGGYKLLALSRRLDASGSGA
jgi:CubicO group peptidase (beta-lactamase class C family)